MTQIGLRVERNAGVAPGGVTRNITMVALPVPWLNSAPTLKSQPSMLRVR